MARRIHRWAARGVAALTVFALVGCGDPFVAARIDGWRPAQSSVVLTMDTCAANLRVASVDETAEVVVIAVEERGSVTDDCADSITVELDSPVGGRQVVDAVTGSAVPELDAGSG